MCHSFSPSGNIPSTTASPLHYSLLCLYSLYWKVPIQDANFYRRIPVLWQYSVFYPKTFCLVLLHLVNLILTSGSNETTQLCLYFFLLLLFSFLFYFLLFDFWRLALPNLDVAVTVLHGWSLHHVYSAATIPALPQLYLCHHYTSKTQHVYIQWAV